MSIAEHNFLTIGVSNGGGQIKPGITTCVSIGGGHISGGTQIRVSIGGGHISGLAPIRVSIGGRHIGGGRTNIGVSNGGKQSFLGGVGMKGHANNNPGAK